MRGRSNINTVPRTRNLLYSKNGLSLNTKEALAKQIQQQVSGLEEEKKVAERRLQVINDNLERLLLEKKYVTRAHNFLSRLALQVLNNDIDIDQLTLEEMADMYKSLSITDKDIERLLVGLQQVSHYRYSTKNLSKLDQSKRGEVLQIVRQQMAKHSTEFTQKKEDLEEEKDVLQRSISKTEDSLKKLNYKKETF